MFAPVPGGTTVEEATASLLAAVVGDGLPVVPPTAPRWDAMLDVVPDPDATLGVVPPLFGELTARLCAGCCVLAGARPDALPVVLAAARAALAPQLNLLGVHTTTGTAALALVVHGPVADRLGLTRGTNLLGPGPHANGVVGRALAMTLAVAGGVSPGTTTMATTGQPARYTCCLAADPTGDDAVTVFAIGGTAEVLPRDDRPAPDDVLDPLAQVLATAALASGDPYRMTACEQTIVLPPEVRDRLPGLDVVRRELFTRGRSLLDGAGVPGAVVAADPDAIRLVVTGGPGIKMLHLPGWIGGSRGVTFPV